MLPAQLLRQPDFRIDGRMQININGDPALVTIERAISELRCGRAIFCANSPRATNPSTQGRLIASAETASASLLSRLELVADNGRVSLAMTQQRAEILGLPRIASTDGVTTHGAVLLRLPSPVSPSSIRWLSGGGGIASLPREFSSEPCDALTSAALNLAKQAHLLPALLVVDSPAPSPEDVVLYIDETHLHRLAKPSAIDLERVSEARVPLAGHEHCRLVLFRDGRDASEHVAIMIGSPPDHSPVPVRMHSACLTGDLLASLRCDCGDQLRTAVNQLAAAGGGVLLYLAQEGRGIGLANKLRAYELQDSGLDTLDADRHLGFDADERHYASAAGMLRHLGVTRIQLLTNNLEKISALQDAGIEVVSGQRLIGAVNRHNVRYINAKRERAGHLVPETNVETLP